MKSLNDFIEDTDHVIEMLDDSEAAMTIHNDLHDLAQEVRNWRGNLPSFKHDEFPQFLDAAIEELEYEIVELVKKSLEIHHYLKEKEEDEEQFGSYEQQGVSFYASTR